MAKKGKQTKHNKNANQKMQNAKTKKKINTQLYNDVRSNLNVHEWPFYKSFITTDELHQLLTEFKQINFKYSSVPYKPILYNRLTPILPVTYKGKYTKFIDDNYLKYDVLPLIYSEPELLKCQFRTNPPALTYFRQHQTQLAAEFLKQHKPQTAAEYREFLFSKVKQCNNFRPTLALQTYNFLDDRNLATTEKQTQQAILDFSAGWGDRLFAACIGDKKYIGLDPNINNTPIYDSIIKNHGKPNIQKVIATGAEYISIADLKIHMTAMNINQFDLIFTSPPYFDYEIYADATQSISNYNVTSSSGFDKWLTYFLLNVIMRYVPLLRDNGYIGIYIQDADSHNYLEPIGLFALAYAEQLGLTVCGIISSTRYPFIVLQKVGTRAVLPYKNPDNGKVFTKPAIHGLFRKHYPVVYQLCDRLVKLNRIGMITPVLTGNKPEYLHQRNIFFRAFEKVFMQLELNVTCAQLDKSVTEKIPSYVVQYFIRLLSHFKIKLVTTPVNGNKSMHVTMSRVIMKPITVLTNQAKMQVIPLEPILANTLDEWQLLNNTLNTDTITNISQYFVF